MTEMFCVSLSQNAVNPSFGQDTLPGIIPCAFERGNILQSNTMIGFTGQLELRALADQRLTDLDTQGVRPEQVTVGWRNKSR